MKKLILMTLVVLIAMTVNALESKVSSTDGLSATIVPPLPR